RGEGLLAAAHPGVGPRQGAVRLGPPADGRRRLDLVRVVPPGRADRRPGVAEPGGRPADPEPTGPGPYPPAALERRPRRGAGLRVHDPRQADEGPRPLRRAAQDGPAV